MSEALRLGAKAEHGPSFPEDGSTGSTLKSRIWGEKGEIAKELIKELTKTRSKMWFGHFLSRTLCSSGCLGRISSGHSECLQNYPRAMQKGFSASPHRFRSNTDCVA